MKDMQVSKCNVQTMLWNLLSTSSTKVLLNGEPGDTIRHRRGLRQGDPLSSMLFIIVMDVLSRLVAKVEDLRLLEPLARRPLGHRISIYADDVVMFTLPQAEDLTLIKALLKIFGDASGLCTNMAKSSIVPIRCDDDDVQTVWEHLDCAVADFPCKYLGLLLSI